LSPALTTLHRKEHPYSVSPAILEPAMQPTPLDSPTTPTGGPTMRSIVQERYGPAPEDVLRLATIGRPTIGRDDVLVRVRAASVDRGTWHVLAGLPYPIRLAGFGLRRPKFAN